MRKREYIERIGSRYCDSCDILMLEVLLDIRDILEDIRDG